MNVIERFRKRPLIFRHGGKGVNADGSYKPDDYLGFSEDMYLAAYGALKNLHIPYLTHLRIVDLSRWIAMHKAMESAWGSKVSGSFNYGGVKGRTGTVKSTIDYVNGLYIRRNQTFRDFNSIKDYCNYVVNLLSNNRYNAFNTHSASHPFQFWRHVLDAGYGGGDAAGKNTYMNSVSKIYSMIKRTMV